MQSDGLPQATLFKQTFRVCAGIEERHYAGRQQLIKERKQSLPLAESIAWLMWDFSLFCSTAGHWP